MNMTLLQLFVASDELSPNGDSYLGYIENKNAYRADFIPTKWVLDLICSLAVGLA